MERADDKPMDINELHAKVHALNAERFKRERDDARANVEVLRDAMRAVRCGNWKDPDGFRAFAAQVLAATESARSTPSPEAGE